MSSRTAHSGGMDVGGSLLDLACVRVAVLPTGSGMSDDRFEELAGHISSLREVPLNALPRRATNTRAFKSPISGNATFSHAPAELRSSASESGSNSFSGAFFSRTFSYSKDTQKTRTISASPAETTSTQHELSNEEKNDSAVSNSASEKLRKEIPKGNTFSTTHEMIERFSRQKKNNVPAVPSEKRPFPIRRTRTLPRTPSSHRDVVDLDLSSNEVDSLFRLRYDIIYRDHSGSLILRPSSEWESFHSRKLWGVIGIADCTEPGLCDTAEGRESIIEEAKEEFDAALKLFPSACVSRLIVFTTPDAVNESGAFVMDSPSIGKLLAKNPTSNYTVGYIPELEKQSATRLEVRAQIIHFSDLILNSLSRECWKMQETSNNDLFLSPLDEKNSADKLAKLSKRRIGRLEKFLGDNFLLMGSAGEALTKFNSAIDKAKTNGDRLWMAGAMEGWSAAFVFNHVSTGGAVDDPKVCDKLIEHYTEIYRLYHKKRVAELEASAALRLAEFLGRWGKRRKDALEAAQHAAVVGEGLRLLQRVALWEALARFSEHMGCRRKAAYFLYRIGQVSATNAIWSSAEALLTACASQFDSKSRIIWPDLHRAVLLEAARAAAESGDAFRAATHRVEALALSPSMLHLKCEEDADLVQRLSSTSTPVYIPAASSLISLHSLQALRSPNLVIKEVGVNGDLSVSVSTKASTSASLMGNGGPFIYHPSEARARAKAAAAASRAVTWVCGERARVSVQIQNRTGAYLPVEVIAVGILDSDQRAHVWPSNDCSSAALSAGSSDTVSEDVIDPEVLHAKRVKHLLRSVSETIETTSETIILPPSDCSAVVKTISVLPRKVGRMKIFGLVIRLFRGAIVLLPFSRIANGAFADIPINVIASLPKLSVSVQEGGEKTTSAIAEDQPITVYEGERRRCSVCIRNIGLEDIVHPKMTLSLDQNSSFSVFEVDEMRSSIDKSTLAVGSSLYFEIDIVGKYGHLKSDYSSSGLEQTCEKKDFESSIITVHVNYVGKTDPNVARESRTSATVIVKQAVNVWPVSIFKLPLAKEKQNFNGAGVLSDEQFQEPRYGMILEVRNLSSMGLCINLPSGWISRNMFLGNESSSPTNCPSADLNVIEKGASARVIASVPDSFPIESVLRSCWRGKNSSFSQAVKSAFVDLEWSLPGVGRSGFVEMNCADISRASIGSINVNSHGFNDGCLNFDNRIHVNIRVSPDFRNDNQGFQSTSKVDFGSLEGMQSTMRTKVRARKFYKGTVTICNRHVSALSENCSLNISLSHQDGRGGSDIVQQGSIFGSTRNVRVGALAPNGIFEHSFQIRLSSVGVFMLSASVLDVDPKNMSQWEENLDFSKLDDNEKDKRGSNVVVETSTTHLHPKDGSWKRMISASQLVIIGGTTIVLDVITDSSSSRLMSALMLRCSPGRPVPSNEASRKESDQENGESQNHSPDIFP